jgi:hypothetical protein
MRRGAESQSHRCKEVHRGRGAAEQRRLEADDEVEDPPERSREEEAGEYGGCDEAARLEAAATRQVELLHVHGSGARGVVCRVRAVLERSGDVASMTWAEGDGRPALQRAERRHARAQARYEHARLAEHPCGRLGGAGGTGETCCGSTCGRARAPNIFTNYCELYIHKLLPELYIHIVVCEYIREILSYAHGDCLYC